MDEHAYDVRDRTIQVEGLRRMWTYSVDTYGVTWGYETVAGRDCYHIYPYRAPANAVCAAIILDIPETPDNDNDVHVIVQALRRMVQRHHQGTAQ